MASYLKRGRPSLDPSKRREATNISLSPGLKSYAMSIAEGKGVSFSELVESSLVRELGSDGYRATRQFYEFFAGGGMAKVGLGEKWNCTFASDFCEKKQQAYISNHGREPFLRQCISTLDVSDLPGRADLAWASFPRQDLSLAGNRDGLAGSKSGAFWPFWRLMSQLVTEGRGPRAICIENVPGMLSSNGGDDFAAICHEMALDGYKFGAVVVDAALFLPQSRKRVFIVAFAGGERIADGLVGNMPSDEWHPAALRRAVAKFSRIADRQWLWLDPFTPVAGAAPLSSILEDPPQGVKWNSNSETEKLLSMMTPVNRRKIEEMMASDASAVGALYKRTRTDSSGKKCQRAEVRFDLAGCLRTPGGGSSRQTLVIVRNGEVQTRLVSPREAARLMGLPDSYSLPEKYNEACHLLGDGLAVPAVSFVAESILVPSLFSSFPPKRRKHEQVHG